MCSPFQTHRSAYAGLWVLAIVVTGCQESHRPAVTQPSDSLSRDDSALAAPSAAPMTPTAEPAPIEVKKPTPRRKPRRPVDSWIVFRAAADPDEDVICNYQWTGENRLEVVTQNVTRLTLDLTKLPDGAPRRGPWNVQIDKQGIEVTGIRGKVLDLVRSANGIWSVDREKSPRKE